MENTSQCVVKKSQDCHFLQLSRCEPQPDNLTPREPKFSYTGNDKEVYKLRDGWAYEYATVHVLKDDYGKKYISTLKYCH
eukprot:scaffold422644_cov102-Attheya_sp.AAC.1